MSNDTTLTRPKGLLAIEEEVDRQAHDRGTARYKKRKITSEHDDNFEPQSPGEHDEDDENGRWMVLVHNVTGVQIRMPKSGRALAKHFRLESRINARLLRKAIRQEAWGTNVAEWELDTLDFQACHQLFPQFLTKEFDVRALPLPREDASKFSVIEKRIEVCKAWKSGSERMIQKMETFLRATSQPGNRRTPKLPTDVNVPVETEIIRYMVENHSMQPAEVTAMADTIYRHHTSLLELFRRGGAVVSAQARAEEKVVEARIGDLLSLMTVLKGEIVGDLSERVDPALIMDLLSTEYHACKCVQCRPTPGKGINAALEFKMVSRKEADLMAQSAVAEQEDDIEQMEIGDVPVVLSPEEESRLKAQSTITAVEKLKDILADLDITDRETPAYLVHCIQEWQNTIPSDKLAEPEEIVAPIVPATRLHYQRVVEDMDTDHTCYEFARQVADGEVEVPRFHPMDSYDALGCLDGEEEAKIWLESREKQLPIFKEMAESEPLKYMSLREQAVWFKSRGEFRFLDLITSYEDVEETDTYTIGTQQIQCILRRGPECADWPISHEHITESGNLIKKQSVIDMAKDAVEIFLGCARKNCEKGLETDPNFRIDLYWKKFCEENPNQGERCSMNTKRRMRLDEVLGRNIADPDDIDSDDDEETAQQKATRRRAKAEESQRMGSAPTSHAQSVWQRMKTFPEEVYTSTGDYYEEGTPKYRFNAKWDLIDKDSGIVASAENVDEYLIRQLYNPNALVKVGEKFVNDLAEFRVEVAKAGLGFAADEQERVAMSTEIVRLTEKQTRCLEMLEKAKAEHENTEQVS